MKKISLFVLLVSISVFVFAEGPAITFEKTTHDFQEINENGGPAKYNFEFTNTGDEPLVVNTVRASCGCTTPEWTKTPIEPGEKGIISVAYNPKGRPGSFAKSISVTTNAGEAQHTLIIKGKVVSVVEAPKTVEAPKSSVEAPK
ncbi:MAG: DUF1573 domain-containing protein [Prevotellaceae bacterium]|jgi:hypothetical protein|nr:DUF1573 domain-containing protein [Prevotellaceae bacterium]